MIEWLRVLLVLLQKEARLELRGKEILTLLLCNAILMSALVGAGISSAMIDRLNTTRVFPMLLWLIFLLTTTASVVRAYEQELENRGFEGLLLAGVTGSQIYVAKVISMTFLFFCNIILLSVVLAAALDQQLSTILLPLALLGLCSASALAALIVVLAAVASTSRMRGVLLPIIALPLLFPLFFAGVEMTTELVVRGAIDLTLPWPSILLCANALYFALGINLFEYAIRD